MSDFLSFIKAEHARREQIKKAAPGQIFRPPEDISEDAFTDLVWEGERQKFSRQQRPVYKGEVVLDRKPTFVDTVCASAAGYDVRRRDAWDDWQEQKPDLADIDLSDLAAWLSGDA